jgi:ABC-2 type transport system ATP-binding protein
MAERGGPWAIEATELTRRFGQQTAVDGIDLRVRRGEVFGFLGPNGAGKTTTLRMLCGLLRPTAGEIRVAGADVLREPVKAKGRIGYLDEQPFLYPHLTGREFLDFVAALYSVAPVARDERAGRLLAALDLSERQHDLVAGYSQGMRQRIGLAALLIHEPDVLFLDEPTNGLDPRSARLVRRLIEELAAEGRTVVLSTHILGIAQALCNTIAIMDGGRIVAVGSLSDLRRQAGVSDADLEDIFLRLTAESGAESLWAPEA